jgi:hypothetical protein
MDYLHSLTAKCSSSRIPCTLLFSGSVKKTDDHDMSKSKRKGPQGMPQGASSSQATSMEVDGSGAAPVGAGSGTGVQQQSLHIASSLGLGRSAAAPARGRPNMLGRTRPSAGLVRRPGDASAGPPVNDSARATATLQPNRLGQEIGLVDTLQQDMLGQVT